MTWSNYDDVLAQLRAVGLVIDGGLIANKFVRCKVENADAELRGWYKLFEHGDLLTGAFGSWSGNEPSTYKVELPKAERKRLTADEVTAIRERQKAEQAKAAAEQLRRQEKAAVQAARWWRQLADAGESRYMARKGFSGVELFGARISAQGNLVVPVQDTADKKWGLQVIYPSKSRKGRDKDFTPPGLAKKGHFYPMGIVQRGGVMLLCEGFATGATLRKATGLPVVVAFDAGNLTPVALAMQKAHRKQLHILVCADDDYLTDAKTGRNPGRDAAHTAALAVDGAVVWPVFPGERPTDSKGPTDFNDLHCHPDGGLVAVRAQIEAAITAAGWGAKPAPGVGVHRAQGGGEGDAGGAGAGGAGNAPGRRAAAIMSVDDLVARFVPIDDGTGKYVFDLWTNKIALRDQMIALLPAGARGDDIKRHPTYIERGAYFLDQVGFDPSGKDANVLLNTWRGWPLAPKAGSCERILELLRYLCGDEPGADKLYTWVLRWMAYPLQNPGAKMASAIIMHGPQGTGKSTVWQCLAKIYGDYATVLNQRGLEDRFNADWVDSKLFILAEEVVTRAEMWHIKNELKELISGEWIRVNPKNVAAYRQRNQVNGVFLSNENQPLPLDNDDRRHCVIYTPPPVGEDFYDEVHLEIEQGGVAALYAYLLALDMGDFHPKKRPPMTDAKRALIDLSSPSEMRFIHDWVTGDAGLPVCPARSTDVYAMYLRWCRANGETRPRPSNQFFGAVARMPGWQKTKARVYQDLQYTGDSVAAPVLIPPDHIIDKNLARIEGASQSHWLTECTIEFANATKNDTWTRASA